MDLILTAGPDGGQTIYFVKKDDGRTELVRLEDKWNVITKYRHKDETHSDNMLILTHTNAI